LGLTTNYYHDSNGTGRPFGAVLFHCAAFAGINRIFISTADSSAMTWYTFVALVVGFAVLAALLIALWIERR
jgi:hypothetical protein